LLVGAWDWFQEFLGKIRLLLQTQRQSRKESGQ